MRILLLDQFGEMGGAQFGLLEAAAGFHARGWELHALVPDGPLQQALKPFCESVASLPSGPFRPVSKTAADAVRFSAQFFQQIAIIRNVVSAHSIDVLYVNGPRLIPAAVCGRGTRPLVFHSHSIVQQRSVAWLTGKMLQAADASVLISSQFVAGWLKPYVPHSRIQVIYNGVAGFNQTPKPRAQYSRIGVLGRIAPEKRQLLFVEAALQAAARNPALQFVVCGGPVLADHAYYNSVRRAAGTSVHFLNWTQDISKFFEQIDILVVPSARVDANPRVIVEAFAAGVPVIAFDSGGISELIEDGVSGILVRDHTAASLATPMVNAVQDPERLNSLALRGYARWQSLYRLSRFQSEVSDAVEVAVGEARTPVQRERARASA